MDLPQRDNRKLVESLCYTEPPGLSESFCHYRYFPCRHRILCAVRGYRDQRDILHTGGQDVGKLRLFKDISMESNSLEAPELLTCLPGCTERYAHLRAP